MAEKFEFFFIFFFFFKIASYPIQYWPENGRFMVKPTLLLKVLYNINKGRIYFFLEAEGGELGELCCNAGRNLGHF